MVLFTGTSVEEAIQNGLRELDIPRMKAHIKVISREKKGFLGLFGKKLAQVDVEAINETTVVKANQRAVKGVPDIINAQNEPVKSVSEATVDLGHVVAAIKKIEELEIREVEIRTPLTCKLEKGVCRKCYGLDLSNHKEILKGDFPFIF